jgi:SAM-dependent methyltransferase
MSNALSLVGRVTRAWRRLSFGQFCQLLAYNMYLVLTGKYSEYAHPYDVSFDRKFNVETRGTEVVEELSADETLARHARRYEAVTTEQMSVLMSKLPALDFSQFTFVDLGSGKGRALFIAAEYPFKRIVGVEYGRELNDLAIRNIKTYHNPAQRCFNIESVCADASAYEFPSGSAICFMNNPFDEVLMQKLMDGLTEALKKAPRDFFIVYLYANHPGIVSRREQWELLHSGVILPRSPYAIWRWNS